MASLWGAYGALRQHDMICSCRKYPQSFRIAVDIHRTSLAMGYSKPCNVEVRQRGNTTLEDVAGPLNKAFIGDGQLHFIDPESLWTQTMEHFYRIVKPILGEKEALRRIPWSSLLLPCPTTVQQQEVAFSCNRWSFSPHMYGLPCSDWS